MAANLSPHDMANIIPTPMSTSHPTRRTSRSSTSQSGCRSSRIEKPKSNHNSPRTMERRKTTTGTKLYATLDDHFNMMFGNTGEEEVIAEQQQRVRPMSWHPSSKQFHVPQQSSVSTEQMQAQEWPRHYSPSSRNSVGGSDFYSLSARNSMHPDPVQNTPTHMNYEAHRNSQDSDSSWQEVQQTPSYALSTYSTPATEPMPWYLQEWTRKNQIQAMNSQHGSNDFLPIQHPSLEQDSNSVDEEMEDSGKELVGMGLYDLPEPSLTWNSGLVEATGKGLKLEETWQPPEEDDNEEDEEDDDASSEASVEEPPPPANHDNEQLKMPVDIKPQTPSNMDGQSFFFDEDESLAKEWWFQQLKQPSMPVRDAGIGYGWL